MLKKITIAIIFLLLASGNLFGGGFQINEHGARAMSMAGAFTGLADDASSVYFNPAGISLLKGTNIMGGATLIKPLAAFRGIAPDITEYKLEEQYFNPINLYLTHQFSDKFFIGISVNNPFGLGTKWDDDWVGRFLAVETDVETYFVTPVIAYKVLDNLSLSAGVSYVYANVFISKYKDLAPFDGSAKITMEGDAPMSFAYNASLLYQISKKISFGLAFKSGVELNFEGDSKSEGPSQFSAILPKGDISAKLNLPMNLSAGFAFKALDNLTFTADYQFIGWSSYDKLEVEFDENEAWNTSADRDYEDAFIIRTGVEYWLNEKFALRTGLFYDKHPVKDEMSEPSLPDANRIGFNYGIGYTFGKSFTIDVAYTYMRFDEKKIDNSVVDFNGVYNATAHLMALDFSYNF